MTDLRTAFLADLGISPERFPAAIRELFDKLCAVHKAEFALEQRHGVTHGRPHPAPLITSVITLVVMRHVAFLCPLEAPPPVVEAFRAAGFQWDQYEARPYSGDLAGCTACGYALPAGAFAVCPLCSGAIGPFVYEGPGITTAASQVN